MSRPAQLEQQVKRAHEIQAELLEGTAQSGSDATLPNEPVEPVTPPANVESPVTVSKEEFDKLEQRYRTLQGMHAADGQRHRNDIAQLQTALQDLEDRLVEARKSQVTAAPAPSRYITDADEAEYGDTLDMVRRAAKEEAEALLAKQREADLQRIANLERQLGQVQNTVVPAVENMTRSQEEQVKSQFWAAIDVQVPDWRTVNDDPAFKGWLLEEDPITGATRQQFLSQARNNYNAPRVIAFFKEWKRTQAGGQTPAPNNPQVELAKLVAPGSSRGTPTTGQPPAKQWTGASVDAFYKDIALGKYAGKIDERKKLEADIFLAQQEGRFTP